MFVVCVGKLLLSISLFSFNRLYGGYESLKGGKTSEAMEDFTGGVVESYTLSESNPGLYERILRSAQRSSLMSCSIKVVVRSVKDGHDCPLLW